MAERRGIGANEVLIGRRPWNRLRDALYRLQAAAEDVALDLTRGSTTKTEYIDALAHLSSAVRDLQDVVVEPIAIHDD